MMLTTVMFLLRFGTPGRRQQNTADVELDFDSGGGGPVQRLDDLRIDQGIELGDDAGFLAVVFALGLGVDHLDDSLAEPDRGGVDLAEPLRQREPGDRVEEVEIASAPNSSLDVIRLTSL